MTWHDFLIIETSQNKHRVTIDKKYRWIHSEVTITSTHSIKTKTFQNVFSFDSRKLTCFCPICMEDKESIDICKNINDNYVKPLKHNEINQKGKMPLTSFEEWEPKDIAISTYGDRIFDLVRECHFMYTLMNAIFYFKYFLLECHIYI